MILDYLLQGVKMTFNDLNKFLNVFKEYPNARIYVYGEEDGYFYGCRMFFGGMIIFMKYLKE